MNSRFNFKEVLKDAHDNHYAIPSFDIFDMHGAKAMMDCAAEYKTPLILMCIAFNHFRPKHFISFIESYSADLDIPVFVHMDHARTVELCKEGIDAGFDSVMIDASADELNENIAKTLEVKKYADARGCAVESEVGHIKNGKITVEGGYVDREDFLVHTEDAVKLVDATHVDLLAVGIGNQHGFYVEEPHIHFDRLKEVHDALNMPLVMHGGSGLPKEMVQESIKGGITKCNVATDFVTHYTDGMLAALNKMGEHPMLLGALDPAMEAGKECVKHWIDTCMSAGKA